MEVIVVFGIFVFCYFIYLVNRIKQLNEQISNRQAIIDALNNEVRLIHDRCATFEIEEFLNDRMKHNNEDAFAFCIRAMEEPKNDKP